MSKCNFYLDLIIEIRVHSDKEYIRYKIINISTYVGNVNNFIAYVDLQILND